MSISKTLNHEALKPMSLYFLSLIYLQSLGFMGVFKRCCVLKKVYFSVPLQHVVTASPELLRAARSDSFSLGFSDPPAQAEKSP